MNIRNNSILLIPWLFLFSCVFTSEEHKKNVKQRQYIVQGQILYLNHCSNCHGESGEGLARLIPPVKNSDYFVNNLDAIACLIRKGQKGAIVVNGIEYSQEMPQHLDLSQLEIAEIITFIANEMNELDTLIEISSVRKALQECR